MADAPGTYARKVTDASAVASGDYDGFPGLWWKPGARPQGS